MTSCVTEDGPAEKALAEQSRRSRKSQRQKVVKNFEGDLCPAVAHNKLIDTVKKTLIKLFG